MRLPPLSWPGAREVREQMLRQADPAERERLLREDANRSTLARSVAPRRRTDEPLSGPYKGNCGRPLDQPCGLVDISECVTHGMGLDDPSDAKSMRARAETALSAALVKLHRESNGYARRMTARIEQQIGPTSPDTADGIRREVFRLKARDLAKRPAIVAALNAHRFRGW